MAFDAKIPTAAVPTILGSDGSPMRRLKFGAQDTSFRAASHEDPALKGFHPPKGSADSDLLPELDDINTRARDLIRNEPVAKSGVEAQLELIVGTGVVVQPKPDHKALGITKEAADEWATRMKSLFQELSESTFLDASRHNTLLDLMRLATRTRIAVGEFAFAPLYLPDRPGAKFGTSIQMIDPDRISNAHDMPDTEYTRSGVIIDDYGAPTAYQVRRAHEADAVFAYSPKVYEWDTIPAYDENGRPRFVLAFEQERADQHRGLSALSAMMGQFKVLSEYKSAELQAALANAVVAAFTESTMPMDQLLELFGGDAAALIQNRADYNLKLQSGTVLPLFPGDKFSSHNTSRPNTAFPSFVDNVLKHIAAGFGIPKSLLMKDFSVGSYSTIKAELNSAYKAAGTAREWLKTHFLDVLYKMVVEEAVGRGYIDADAFYENQAAWCRCDWIFDGRGWLDPVREAQAAQVRIATGISTFQIECAEQGLDWEDVFRQRAREQAYMRDLGLDAATILQTVAVAPQSEPEKTADEEDEEEQASNPAIQQASRARWRLF